MNDARTTDDSIRSVRDEYDALRFVSEESPCPYLPGRMARNEVYLAEGIDPDNYTLLLNQGFRRSGRIVYRPRCRGCNECRQLRVLVDSFVPTRSMRRVLRRNADLSVEVHAPEPTEEKHEIYAKYLRSQHDGKMSDDADSFVGFLYDSPMVTLEFAYSLGQRLIAVSLVDACSDGMSSVYMYFDPDFAYRSPGTYSILWEIDHCRRLELAYYYLGFFVGGCRAMNYKARFRPNEVLVGIDRWITLQA